MPGSAANEECVWTPKSFHVSGPWFLTSQPHSIAKLCGLPLCTHRVILTHLLTGRLLTRAWRIWAPTLLILEKRTSSSYSLCWNHEQKPGSASSWPGSASGPETQPLSPRLRGVAAGRLTPHGGCPPICLGLPTAPSPGLSIARFARVGPADGPVPHDSVLLPTHHCPQKPSPRLRHHTWTPHLCSD